MSAENIIIPLFLEEEAENAAVIGSGQYHRGGELPTNVVSSKWSHSVYYKANSGAITRHYFRMK